MLCIIHSAKFKYDVDNTKEREKTTKTTMDDDTKISETIKAFYCLFVYVQSRSHLNIHIKKA